MRASILLILIAVSCWPRGAPAQQPPGNCSQGKYSPPQIHSKSYRLSRVEGQAVYASPSQKWELGSGNGLCVTLYRRDGEFVAAVTTDQKGQFEFAGFATGEYVLIAFAGDLQKITIPIRIVFDGKAHKPQRLLLHLREKEDTRKSYATPVTNLWLRKELLALVAQDQKVRDELIKSGVDHPDKAIVTRMDTLDARNTARMRTIIKEFGWPGVDLVGWDGTEAAFILVQHAAHWLQKELLPLIQSEFKTGELTGPNYALFLDRVLVDDGKPQVYGTRGMPFDQWKGEAMLYPIEDEANVDKRRAEVGLSPLAEYRRYLKRMYYPQK